MARLTARAGSRSRRFLTLPAVANPLTLRIRTSSAGTAGEGSVPPAVGSPSEVGSVPAPSPTASTEIAAPRASGSAMRRGRGVVLIDRDGEDVHKVTGFQRSFPFASLGFGDWTGPRATCTRCTGGSGIWWWSRCAISTWTRSRRAGTTEAEGPRLLGEPDPQLPEAPDDIGGLPSRPLDVLQYPPLEHLEGSVVPHQLLDRPGKQGAVPSEQLQLVGVPEQRPPSVPGHVDRGLVARVEEEDAGADHFVLG